MPWTPELGSRKQVSEVWREQKQLWEACLHCQAATVTVRGASKSSPDSLVEHDATWSMKRGNYLPFQRTYSFQAVTAFLSSISFYWFFSIIIMAFFYFNCLSRHFLIVQTQPRLTYVGGNDDFVGCIHKLDDKWSGGELLKEMAGSAADADDSRWFVKIHEVLWLLGRSLLHTDLFTVSSCNRQGRQNKWIS